MKVSIQGLISAVNRKTAWLDRATQALISVLQPHHETHEGRHYYVIYSVASLGAMAAPDDMITLTFTTPNTTRWSHFTFLANGTGGWRLRLIEDPTGGAESQTEQLPVWNRNRNSSNVSDIIALDSTPGEVSYDATLATGGNSLWDEIIAGGAKWAGLVGNGRDEIVLKQNTKYQLSLYGADADPATLYMDWYEHTDKHVTVS